VRPPTVSSSSSTSSRLPFHEEKFRFLTRKSQSAFNLVSGSPRIGDPAVSPKSAFGGANSSEYASHYKSSPPLVGSSSATASPESASSAARDRPPSLDLSAFSTVSSSPAYSPRMAMSPRSTPAGSTPRSPPEYGKNMLAQFLNSKSPSHLCVAAGIMLHECLKRLMRFAANFFSLMPMY
jgi:hypothetical protein